MTSETYSIGGHLFAAGLGTRLAPLTDTVPKPLVPVKGIPIIYYTLSLLNAIPNMLTITINTHHLSQIFDQHTFPEKCLVYREPTLCGHGNSVKNLQNMHTEDVIIAANADTILSIEPSVLTSYLDRFMHEKNEKSVGLLITRTNNKATLGYSSSNQLLGLQRNEREFLEYRQSGSDGIAYFADALGVFFIRKTVYENLSHMLLDEEFVGFFGRNDLLQQLIRHGGEVYSYDSSELRAYGLATLDDLDRINSTDLQLPYDVKN